ncbi:MAG: molecular chaperone TorD family protein [Alphaproteobacteria bacterium]|nr:molecular chaperone TorD family protein [Alphaproteobacteria bacterium]MBF0372203.1 molecular chaperone TorD family protein [Alphaproteobacteria bacterium]
MTATQCPPSRAAELGSLYHFLELALAHPGEDGFDYFRRPETEHELARLLSGHLPRHAGPPLADFFGGLRKATFEEVEAAYISLFSANFPQVPCPPYGSLFTAEDDGKRLEEMLAIKAFYAENGVDVSESFDDLPDHLCVELEFLQLLCFREHDAAAAGDAELAAALRGRQAVFLDRFVLPFMERLAALAAKFDADNPYSHLLDATRLLLTDHRSHLGECLP